jgi:CHASE2 domain-containing sensor protein
MKFAVRARGWLLVALSVLAVVLVLRALGGLASFEHRAADARARVLQHEVDTDIVIVGIDARSLADLPRWPWPRRYHARLLERLADAQPRRVFVDIDFSSRTDPADDALLADSLARFDRAPLILPIFLQHATGSGSDLSITQPLEDFRRRATLAGVNFPQEADSLVRTATNSSDLAGTTIPSAFTLLAAVDAPADRDVPIDFSISLASFDFVSYVDLLAGRIDPAHLRDKTVLVGATASELGDMLPVPVYQFQPGVVVQALAAQTLREGAPRVMPEWLYIVALACLAALSAFVFEKYGWRRNLLAGCS